MDKLDKDIIKFQNTCYTIVYKDLMNGIICEKEHIFNAFIFFLKVDDIRMEITLNMIKKYYNEYLSELFESKLNELIRFENYEMCEKLKKIKASI